MKIEYKNQRAEILDEIAGTDLCRIVCNKQVFIVNKSNLKFFDLDEDLKKIK